MKKIFFICLGVWTFPIWSASVQVANLRDPLVLQDTQTSLRPGRGLKVAFPMVATLGQGGILLLEGDNESTLSILGPALVRFEERDGQMLGHLDYGSFYIKGRLPGLEAYHLHGQDLGLGEYFAEVPVSRESARLWTLESSLAVGASRLYPDQVGFLALRRFETSPSDASDLRALRQLHVPSTAAPLREAQEKEGRISLRRSIDLGQNTGFNLLSSAPSSVDQGISFGLFLEYLHRVYFKLPGRPQRVHFLKAPALRLGGGLSWDWNRLRPVASYEPYTRFFNIYSVVGMQWLGLHADGVVGYRSARSELHQVSSPLGWSLRAGYSLDLYPSTLTEMEMRLGATYTSAAFAAVAGAKPPKYSWQLVGLQMALSFRF